MKNLPIGIQTFHKIRDKQENYTHSKSNYSIDYLTVQSNQN